MITQDQIDKVRDYLLDHGQQELAGHLDGAWQEVQDSRSKADAQYREENSVQPGETVQDFQDRLKDSPSNDSPDTHTSEDPSNGDSASGKS